MNYNGYTHGNLHTNLPINSHPHLNQQHQFQLASVTGNNNPHFSNSPTINYNGLQGYPGQPVNYQTYLNPTVNQAPPIVNSFYQQPIQPPPPPPPPLPTINAPIYYPPTAQASNLNSSSINNVMFDPYFNSQMNIRQPNYPSPPTHVPFVYSNPIQTVTSNSNNPPYQPVVNSTYDSFYNSHLNFRPVDQQQQHQVLQSAPSPIHVTTQVNSGSTNYPIPFNYNSPSISSPQIPVHHTYPLQSSLHPVQSHQIIPSGLPLHNSNNNNNNHYYPQPYPMSVQYPSLVSPQQQQKYTNYVHPIAPSVSNVPVANRKADYGSPVTSVPAATVNKAAAAATPTPTTGTGTTEKPTTAKPLELEMSLEDLFRLAQISNMFSNMSFISMDQLASPSDTKVQIPKGNSKIAHVQSNPVATEEGKNEDGRKLIRL